MTAALTSITRWRRLRRRCCLISALKAVLRCDPELHYEETRELPPLVTVTQDAGEITLSGLPEGVGAFAAVYGANGSLRYVMQITVDGTVSLGPAESDGTRLRVFFLDAQLLPVSAPWQPD